MKRALFAFTLVGAVALSACHGDIPVPRETITFVYKFAEQRQPNRYYVEVLRGTHDPRTHDPADCVNQVEDVMRLDQIAFTVQRLGNPSLINVCHERFSVDVVTARAADDDFAKFDFAPLPDTSERRGQVIANLNYAGDTFPVPSRIQIETYDAVIEGIKVTHGVAEISFGSAGPIYRCEGNPGEDFWDDHILDPETDTFFEFTLTSYNPSTRGLGAKFQCLARNSSDPTDDRLLLVMLGSVFITADN